VTYGLYLVFMVCNDIRVTFLSVTHHVGTYVHTYVRTYVLCENRSFIQSFVLMRSAILTKILLQVHIYYQTILIATFHYLLKSDTDIALPLPHVHT